VCLDQSKTVAWEPKPHESWINPVCCLHCAYSTSCQHGLTQISNIALAFLCFIERYFKKIVNRLRFLSEFWIYYVFVVVKYITWKTILSHQLTTIIIIGWSCTPCEVLILKIYMRYQLISYDYDVFFNRLRFCDVHLVLVGLMLELLTINFQMIVLPSLSFTIKHSKSRERLITTAIRLFKNLICYSYSKS